MIALHEMKCVYRITLSISERGERGRDRERERRRERGGEEGVSQLKLKLPVRRERATVSDEGV